MVWLWFAFGSVFFFTSLNLLQRKLAVESQNARAMAVLFNSIAALLAILLSALTGSLAGIDFPTEPNAWLALLVAAVCYALFERWRFVAAKLLDASVLTTVGNVAVLVAFVGSVFVYSETLTIQKLLGALLVISALLLVSYQTQSSKVSPKGLVVAVGISGMLGLAWMLDKLGTQFFTANTYNVLVWTVPIPLIFFPYIKLDAIRLEWKRSSWNIFLLAGLNVLGYFLQLKALEVAEATRVIPIIQTTTLFTVLMGIVLLGERDNMWRKVAAGLVAMVGVYLLI